MLILLDLCAAFATVVYELLLEDLVLIGIGDDVINWFVKTTLRTSIS